MQITAICSFFNTDFICQICHIVDITMCQHPKYFSFKSVDTMSLHCSLSLSLFHSFALSLILPCTEPFNIGVKSLMPVAPNLITFLCHESKPLGFHQMPPPLSSRFIYIFRKKIIFTVHPHWQIWASASYASCILEVLEHCLFLLVHKQHFNQHGLFGQLETLF